MFFIQDIATLALLQCFHQFVGLIVPCEQFCEAVFDVVSTVVHCCLCFLCLSKNWTFLYSTQQQPPNLLDKSSPDYKNRQVKVT